MRRAGATALFENPLGKRPDWDFAWVRREAMGRINHVADLAHEKLTLRAQRDADWKPKCFRHDVLLPADVDDLWREPDLLFGRLDASVEPPKTDLAIALIFWFPNALTLHTPFETVRAFAAERMVRTRGMATLVAQHAPHVAHQATPMHVHVLTTARRLGRHGFGPYADLAGDAAQEVLWAEWSQHAAAWRG